MTEYNLDPIFEYHMNDEETVAYKIGLLWITLSRQIFPTYKHYHNFPKKGDPRKSSLFKHCYKLLRETRGLIDPKDYKLYIVAQLQMLKSIEIGGSHPLIGPWCIVGDKAWIRWKVWKRKYDNVGKSKTLKEEGLDKSNIDDIKIELDKTKKFLIFKLGELTEENFKLKIKEIERWIAHDMVSGFYAVLSPWVKKYCNLKDVDLNYHKNSINEEVETYFKNLFP